MSEWTELDEMLHKRFRNQCKDKEEVTTLACVALMAEQYDVEKETKAFLDEHPDASLQDLDEYLISIIPPLEVVDDDEIEELN